jgi:hypothetical protein
MPKNYDSNSLFRGVLSQIMPKVIIWTHHAEARQKEWERKKGVTRSQIEKVIIEPEQIVPGDMGVMVAQSRIWGGLIRVPFFEKENEIKILTLYWTSKFEKYWKENE